jgi:hypothetical protein
MKKFLIPILLIAALSNCGPATPPGSAEKPGNDSAQLQRDLVIDTSSGFVDLTFSLSSIEKKDSGFSLHISSAFGNQIAGFNVYIPDNAKKTGFGHGMIISSAGMESDNFLKLLARFYHVNISSDAKFCKADTIAFVDLKQMMKDKDAVNLLGHDLKLFFEREGKTEEEYQYAEVYLNIDKGTGVVEFNEKDPEYREALIKFLSEK